MKRYLALLGATILCASMARADKFSSGLKAGEATPAFPVLDVTGPNKGKALCYV